jgi:8-oxo-dGTP diphosphatase
VYSASFRDPRFHAVTIVIGASCTEPDKAQVNPVEVTEVGLFRDDELPHDFSHGMQDMIQNAISKKLVWE